LHDIAEPIGKIVSEMKKRYNSMIQEALDSNCFDSISTKLYDNLPLNRYLSLFENQITENDLLLNDQTRMQRFAADHFKAIILAPRCF
jgi:hypothetical protein